MRSRSPRHSPPAGRFRRKPEPFQGRALLPQEHRRACSRIAALPQHRRPPRSRRVQGAGGLSFAQKGFGCSSSWNEFEVRRQELGAAPPRCWSSRERAFGHEPATVSDLQLKLVTSGHRAPKGGLCGRQGREQKAVCPVTPAPTRPQEAAQSDAGRKGSTRALLTAPAPDSLGRFQLRTELPGTESCSENSQKAPVPLPYQSLHVQKIKHQNGHVKWT